MWEDDQLHPRANRYENIELQKINSRWPDKKLRQDYAAIKMSYHD